MRITSFSQRRTMTCVWLTVSLTIVSLVMST
jgi:hypothetical protein